MATDFSSSANFKQYSSVAIDAANKYGIPQDMFLWQIGQESSWNPNAQNGNATGIAQFMPATAQSLGIDPTNPTASLFGAAQYDAKLFSTTAGGDWSKVLAQYGTTAGGAATVPAGVTGSGSPATSTSKLPSWWPSNMSSAMGSGFTVVRFVTIGLGFAFIIAALYQFKPVQQVVNASVKTATDLVAS